MSDETIHILSTADIPGFKHTGKPSFEILNFLSIELNPYPAVGGRIRELATETATAVFTSANAVEAVVTALEGMQPSWKIYCIAHSTKTKVLEYFRDSKIAGLAPNSADLAELISDEQAVIFFCGNLRRDDIPNRLKERNILVDELVVYKTVYSPVKLSKNYHGILFFSPGAVASFFSVNAVDKKTTMFAIGSTTKAAISQYCSNRIFTADKPDKIELAQNAINYFEEKINQ